MVQKLTLVGIDISASAETRRELEGVVVKDLEVV
jgi:hypothetical protein